MPVLNYEQSIWELAQRSGIQINGDEPWDIKVHNTDVYRKIVMQGTLGLGEAYMQGMWDCERLDIFFEKILRARVEKKAHASFSVVSLVIACAMMNLQTIARSTKVAKVHYDLNNEFYQAMLDKRMMYSCAYWQHAKTLEQAQENKLRLICEKLQLKEGETLLDIGCGWGGMAKYAAENYGVLVTGVTISSEQAKVAKQACQGLPIEILLLDYRKVKGQFDKIVSIGMFEHVGARNYKAYMDVIVTKLKDEGLFLLHTIGHRYRTFSADPWVNKYIFPNGKIPYLNHIAKAINGKLIMEDWHNFGTDYAKTLAAWHQNFEENWPKFEGQYDQEFYRMWRYYLLSFSGAFRARHMQLWQLIFTKPSRTEGYRSVRH